MFESYVGTFCYPAAKNVAKGYTRNILVQVIAGIKSHSNVDSDICD